jgi:hypothetical protein
MEIVIKIKTEGINPKRELVCDMCNDTLYTDDHKETAFYATFWKDRKDIFYLEKYICEDCYKNIYKKDKAIPFEQAPEIYRQALEDDFQRDYYGYMLSLDDLPAEVAFDLMR